MTTKSAPNTLSKHIREVIDQGDGLTDEEIDRCARELAIYEKLELCLLCGEPFGRASKKVEPARFFRHYILNLRLHGRL
jgi:hypothetical protein